MTKVRMVLAEALKSIGANVSTTVASAVSVLIGMFLIGVFIGLGTWLVSWSDDKKRELAVHLYLCPPPSQVDPNPRCPREATTKEINTVRALLEADSRIKEGGIRFISKGEAFKRMQKREPELTALVVTNPLPASFDVVPKRGEDTEAIALGVQNAKLGAVDEVTWGKEVSKRILQLARGIQIVFLIAIILGGLLVPAGLLIGLRTKLHESDRRQALRRWHLSQLIPKAFGSPDHE